MKVLVIVDMQNDFINGALGTKEAESILSNVQKKINEYREHEYPIIFTRDTHEENYLETQEGKNLPVTHCIYQTKGWEIASQLEPGNAKIVNKPSFGSMELAKYMNEQYPDAEIELIGLCTDICVISNAIILKASNPETKITVDASCCAGVTPQSHKNALEAMKMCQINIINE
jgi:nicotinamidase-related amidase